MLITGWPPLWNTATRASLRNVDIEAAKDAAARCAESRTGPQKEYQEIGSQLPVTLGTKLGRELRLRDQILRVADQFDFVLIDTPPSLGVLTINALVAATRVIVPTEARFFSLQGLQMLRAACRGDAARRSIVDGSF